MIVALCRIVLAATFAAAALPKLAHPRPFAAAVLAYDLLPRRLALAWARILPWLELALAVALGAGFRVRASATVALVLLAIFDAAMVATLLRRREADCGCFGRPSRIGRRTIARDATLMAVAAVVALHA